MRILLKVAGILAAVLVVAVLALGITLSHNSPCKPEASVAPEGQAMTAVVARCYGPPEVLRVTKVPRPVVGDQSVLVKVRAASVNPLDYHYMRGSPYLMRLDEGLGAPKEARTGVDFAGTVEAVGKDVTRFKVGDEVFGGATGSFGQYVAVREKGAIALKPAAVPFDQAAAVDIAGITALQALRDKAQVHAGEKVLINGASGGVGTFAVQIAKSMGAEVTGVCSTRNVELVGRLGADHVIDYTKDDFTRADARYDVIIDTVGNHTFSSFAHVLRPGGRVLVLGAPPGDWIAPLMGFAKVAFLAPFFKQKFSTFLADLKQDDLVTLAGLMEAGKLTPVIDRHFPLAQAPQALAYVESRHARGKVVIDVD